MFEFIKDGTMKSLALRIALLVTAAAATPAFSANGPAPPPTAALAGDATNAAPPRIHFDAPAYDFGKVAAGEVIQHAFIVSNAGGSKLLISDVRGTCSCTTAGTWTKEIEPGQTGVVPIQINSTFLRGAIQKMAIVTSNDKSQPTVTLHLTGAIWQPIEINPPVAYLHLAPGTVSNPPTVIHISNKTDQALTLSTPESVNKLFTAELKTVEPGKEFELSVSALPPVPPGNTTGSITIKTSATNMPVLTITVVAIAPRPAIVVTPQKIILAPAFGSRAAAHNVLIQSTIPQPLVLSSASVNAKGIDVQVKELQAGRQYNLTVTFPPGFQAAADGSLELSVTSNFPQFPVIKVPITQLPDAPGVGAKKG
jgi:hypothetical protein